MALKIPQIIALNSEGILEFLTDKATCIGVKPTDPQDLVEEKYCGLKIIRQRLVASPKTPMNFTLGNLHKKY